MNPNENKQEEYFYYFLTGLAIFLCFVFIIGGFKI